MKRPKLPAPVAELYDRFLLPNGVEGWLPERPTVVVAGDQLTVPIWRHRGNDGPWGNNVMVKSDLDRRIRPEDDGPVVDPRTLPLVVPVTDRVRELARATGMQLVEL